MCVRCLIQENCRLSHGQRHSSTARSCTTYTTTNNSEPNEKKEKDEEREGGMKEGQSRQQEEIQHHHEPGENKHPWSRWKRKRTRSQLVLETTHKKSKGAHVFLFFLERKGKTDRPSSGHYTVPKKKQMGEELYLAPSAY